MYVHIVTKMVLPVGTMVGTGLVTQKDEVNSNTTLKQIYSF